MHKWRYELRHALGVGMRVVGATEDLAALKEFYESLGYKVVEER
jgi:hypothetical protein